MPIIRARYPDNWEAIADQVKREANWRCEQCERPCRKLGEPLVDFFGRVQQWRPGFLPLEFAIAPRRYLLTVAHLDQVPKNCDRHNLKALCTGCHLNHDRQFRGKQQALKREWFGQLRLGVEDEP
ncbi:HNH endonuclease [filamentous cyanobacterium CCP5]|nr:HNH endonuclease [filamentous cyanobacterium CCP5]